MEGIALGGEEGRYRREVRDCRCSGLLSRSIHGSEAGRAAASGVRGVTGSGASALPATERGGDRGGRVLVPLPHPFDTLLCCLLFMAQQGFPKARQQRNSSVPSSGLNVR